MAFGSFSAQVDFRQFNISAAWADRVSSAFGSGGSYAFASVTYNSTYTINFSRPDMATGHLRILGDGFAQNGAGNVSAGTVHAVVGSFTEGISTAHEYYITGASVSAAMFHTAMRTAGLADDQAMLRAMFIGNDIITLSGRDDFAYGADGNDTLLGNNGADKLFGQAGNDVLRGGYGMDTLYGNGGADILIGGPGADTVNGGLGNDTVMGASGVDIFEFRAGDGDDRVLDWTDGVDTLRFYGPNGNVQVAFQDLAGGDVEIKVLGMTIVVENAQFEDFQLTSGSTYVTLT
jgi:Ca2+-binding RTX toxin-like protein